jgi:hypothetical protein
MIRFDAAPPVPLTYPRLSALVPGEIERARAAGYVADKIDPGSPVKRAGTDNYAEPRANDDLHDWRTRMYVIWFCYLYENLLVVEKPLGAIEELILEFKAQDVLDTLDCRLATLYAGAGGDGPSSSAERSREVCFLKPHYTKAITLLDAWNARQR